LSSTDQPAAGSGHDSQQFSLFHDGAEAGLKAWHAPYIAAFGPGRVADIGCGPGYVLDLLRERGILGFGIDNDPAMVAAAKRRGHGAALGDHTTLATMPGAFTGVHLSHIIEHLWGDDAVALLAGAKAALQPGGMLIVRTPNWGNATVRHGGFWLDHTHKRPYPRELLEKLLTDLGFEIMQAGSEPGGWEDTYIVCRVAAARTGEPVRAPVSATPPRARDVPTSGVRFKINWRGDFLADHSFARVNRELAKAMAATGAVEIVPLGEPSERVERTLGFSARRADETSAGLPTFALKHQWPPALLRPQSGYSIHIQPYEYGAIPVSWAEQMPATVDQVWCPSTYIEKLYLDAGMNPEQTFTLPWGVDPAIYNAGIAPLDVDSETAFVFLFVGGTIWRKGIDILLDAYLAEFSPNDDVALIVKAAGSSTFYQKQNVSDRIVGLMQRTDVPIVRYSSADLPETELAALYRRADILVLPYRGEGFGLPVLEAMACGTAPLVTNGGATDDFVTDTTGYRMPARRIPVIDPNGDPLATPGWALETDQPTLRRYMRHAFEHRDEVRRLGANAAAAVRDGYTWAHAAQRAVAQLDVLSQRQALVRSGEYEPLNAYERNISSQNGEDGIILELFSRLRVVNPFFVEFGAETGVECNTAQLARTYDWGGLLIEGDGSSFETLQTNFADFPKVRCLHALIARENIATIFSAHNVPNDLDLLSINADGNGYSLWEALAEYRARVVIVEFNPARRPAQQGPMEHAAKHASQHDDNYGASLTSLTVLGNRLGYALIGIDNNAVNAFFIRRELLEVAGFPERRPEDIYHAPESSQPHRSGPALEL
jgi:glycosyltransferase involved in cell wall biosynthesis